MCTNTTCYKCNQPSICTQNDCSCPVKDLSTDCVLYTGNDLACSGIKSQTILTDLIQQLDEFICTLVEQSINALNLINIGTGADVYKGIDLQGRREIRRINASGDLVTVTQNTDDISVSIDEEALSNFIQGELCFTTDDGSVSIKPQEGNCYDFSVIFREIENVGAGAGFYKTFNPLTNSYEFKTLILDSQSGNGESLVRDVVQNANDVTVRLKKITSDTLTITSNDEGVSVDLPESSQVPALYVNNLYVPSYSEWLNAGGSTNPSFQYKGEGSLSRPFTDSVNYISPSTPVISTNTAIQNALDTYVGTGIFTRLNPEKSGQQITIQKNNTNYTFPGDFSYSNLNLLIEGNVVSTTTGWLVDMDNASYFDSNASSITIRLAEEGVLQITDSLGFRNSGNTSTALPPFDSGRTCFLLGEGTIYSSYNGVDVLNRYLINSEGNYNDLNLHFQVKCKLRADYQGIYLAKNYARYDFYNNLQSSIYLGSVDTDLQAFRMTGGQVRFYEKASINIAGEVSGRNYGITFEPQGDGIGYCIFILNTATVSYNGRYLFSKLNDEPVSFSAVGSNGYGSTTFPLGSNTVVNGLFYNVGPTIWGVEFRNCSYQYTGIDFTQVDLTLGNNISSINTIGGNVIETLVTRDDRASAISSGLPLYSAYLKTSGVAYPATSGWVRDIVLPA